MKKTRLLTLIGTAVVGLTLPALAAPHGGGGFGGGFGGGHPGGGGSRGHVGGFAAGGARAAPHAFGGARFYTGRTMDGFSRPRQFSSVRAGTDAVRSHGFTASGRRSAALGNGSVAPRANTSATIGRQQSRTGSVARQNMRASNSQISRAAARRAIANNQVGARHDGNWHRDWDKHRVHFHNNLVFVFTDGFWWGLYPWDYYPYDAYGSYPSDYYGYPYGYNDYSYDSNDYNTQDPYSYYNGYAGPAQSSNGVVSSVQSQLAKLGYYGGAVDGVA